MLVATFYCMILSGCAALCYVFQVLCCSYYTHTSSVHLANLFISNHFFCSCTSISLLSTNVPYTMSLERRVRLILCGH